MIASKNITRPTSVVEMARRSFQILIPLLVESTRHGMSYQPRPTDLFISPFTKCGVTWLLQIVHGLRTRGDMDFDNIYHVIPWFEWGQFLGLDLQAPQPGTFQAFKSHLSWHEIPKGGRYIVSFRDPKDALVSHYHFYDGWWWEAGSVSIAEFAKRYCTMWQKDWAGSYWDHLTSWWEQRDNAKVLLLSYEGMKADLSGMVQTIADFLGMELDDSLLDLVVRQSSLDFMLAHKAKFAELIVKEVFVKIGFLPPGGDAATVRTGRVGDHRTELPADISDEMDAVWRKVVEARIGLSSYQSLLEAMA